MAFHDFRQDNSSTQSARSAEEKSIRAILFTMSLLFIVCQAWKIVPDVYELFFCRENGHHCKMDGPVSKHVTPQNQIRKGMFNQICTCFFG